MKRNIMQMLCCLDRMDQAERAFLEMARFCRSQNIEARVYWTQKLVLKFEARNEDDEVCLIATIGPERDGPLNVEDFAGKPLFNAEVAKELAEFLMKMSFKRQPETKESSSTN